MDHLHKSEALQIHRWREASNRTGGRFYLLTLSLSTLSAFFQDAATELESLRHDIVKGSGLSMFTLLYEDYQRRSLVVLTFSLTSLTIDLDDRADTVQIVW